MIITTITTIRPTQDTAVVKMKILEPATTLTLALQTENASRNNSQLVIRKSIMINKTADNVRPTQETESTNPNFVVADFVVAEILVVVVEINENVKIRSVIENLLWPLPTFEIKLIF